MQPPPRYFGQSQPFPTDPLGQNLTADQFAWFTVNNVIQDAVAVLDYVRGTLAVPDSTPVVLIGCSYGGMLTTWARASRPDVFDAALSSRWGRPG